MLGSWALYMRQCQGLRLRSDKVARYEARGVG